jgi:hypothetical protein
MALPGNDVGFWVVATRWLGPVVIGLPLVNWAIDALQWGAVAWLLWPREQRAAPAPIDN